MQVRLSGYQCECGAPMMFLDPVQTPRRRMTCWNAYCEHFKKIFLEPVYEAEPAPGR